MCQYIRSVHSVLKRQKLNNTYAICVINVNQTTKDIKSLTVLDGITKFNKNQYIFNSYSDAVF